MVNRNKDKIDAAVGKECNPFIFQYFVLWDLIFHSIDDRTRLQVLALDNDCYKYKMDLVTNGVVITDAIKFVQQKKEELNQMNSDNATSGEEEEANKISKEKEKEKEEVLDSDNIASKNTKNQIF